MTDLPTDSSTVSDAAGLLAKIDVGTWSWEPESGAVRWDEATHRIYGLEPDTFAGTFEEYIELIHPDDRDDVLRVIGDLAIQGGDYSVRHRVITPAGDVRWVEGQGRIMTEDGVPVEGYGIVYPLSERLSLDRERDQLTASEELARADSALSRQRLTFLIELTDAIAGSLNSERVARSFVSHITRSLASVCVVDLQLQEPFGHLMTCIGRDGKSMVTTGSPAALPAAAHRISMPLHQRRPLREDILEMDTAEQRALVPDAAKYVTAFAMEAHGKRVGTVTAVRTDRSWSSDARELLQAATRRAAGAFDRAELNADRSKFVSMFQAAATPRHLPEVPGLDIAVHYRPATDLVRLGGDLYDVFQLDDGSWMVAVGDICGKGIVAAGHAELARTALRSAAFATGEPTAALRVLNKTLLAESSRPMLTAVLIRFTPVTDGFEICVARAGHPPPLVISGLDEWSPMDVSGTMLGVAPDPTVTAAELTLAAGQSVAVYTDGITESRFGATFFGLERLGKTLARAWPASAHSMVGDVAATLDTWSAGQPADDVLLLVARVAPQ